MTSRDRILARLRQRQQPPFILPDLGERRLVQPLADDSIEGLWEVFRTQATALQVNTHEPDSPEAAYQTILAIIGEDKQISAWDFEHIPLVDLENQLAAHQIGVANPYDGSIRVGITGVSAALAATGSIILPAQEGKPRPVSLLPLVHIAVVQRQQILPHLEAWAAQQQTQLSAFQAIGNHIIITGASRTADIAMELVLGAHGPKTLHIIIV